MRSVAGIAVVLLIMVVMYVVLGTFFRDEGQRGPGQQSDDPPPAGVKIVGGLDSLTTRPSASRAWYRYETRSPTRFWGTWAFLFLWGAFLTAAASHFVAALVELAVGLLLLVYAYLRWRGGNRWTPANTAPPPPPPLPMPSSATEDGPDQFVIVRGTSRRGKHSLRGE